ncbi:hypothetical protein Nepgr_028923 [Nepenthes gracilis]|uniref:Uncharacterized protein n=1 Tax=Nepenthes gracilis TaxID=150966 RepID=A0AAD3TB99_NEPGR|nr:hypothetical protein Nepgr_028923 [Nepenthes gracilis]
MDALGCVFSYGKFLEKWAWQHISLVVSCCCLLKRLGIESVLARLGSALVCCNSVAFDGTQLTLTAPLGPGAVGLIDAIATAFLILLRLLWMLNFSGRACILLALEWLFCCQWGC